MRIAMVNWNRRKVGGGESYLAELIPDTVASGHDVALLVERDEPPERDPIALPPGVPWWCVGELGVDAALNRLRSWQPDVILSHGMLDSALERRVLEIAPAVAFTHNYYGTCISGSKSFKSPVVVPCARVFGWKCLLHYYPHSCGGKNPITMARRYVLQAERLEMLERYAAIVTASEHMRREYLRHGFPDDRVHAIPYPTPGLDQAGDSAGERDSANGISLADEPVSALTEPARWHLLFMGRMERLKGGDFMIDALPIAATLLGVSLHATFVGDGPEREGWATYAEEIVARHPDVSVRFTGWQGKDALTAHWRTADLLVVPSLWPEPYGLVGPEAGLWGVPAVAFDVGGIGQWLVEGVNGHLAPANPPTSAGLAAAIVQAVRDPEHRRLLSGGAVRVARQFTRAGHLVPLLELLARAAGAGTPRVG